METRKLYYEDCHMKQFFATVTGCEPLENGYGVTLDATAFYPEGGGQACDTGMLAQARVLAVKEQDGTVVHVCDAPLQAGQTVQGVIDWGRRFDLMQQHTGEHIVSGLIQKRFGYSNVGFHVGNESMEVDFDGPLSTEDVEAIEAQANAAVWENLPVRCWIPSEEALPDVQYRSKRKLPWPVRIVEVGPVDSCACCGVHTAFTGEVGLIKIRSCIKFHSGVRLEILCGGRAMQYLSKILEQNRQVSQAFSAKPLETGSAARRINELLAAEKFRNAGLEKKLFGMLAQTYAGQGNVVHFEPELSPAGVRELAEAIAGCCGGVAAVFSGEEGNYMVCLANPGGDVKALGAAMAQRLCARGGGKQGFYQGSAKADKKQILAFFEEQFS